MSSNKKEVKVNKLINKGLQLFKEKRYHQSIGFFNRALYKNPNSELALLNRAKSTFNYLQKLKRYNFLEYDNIIVDLDKVLGLNSELTEALLLKSMVLELIGTYEESLKCCYEALKINPNKYWLQTAYVHERFKHYPEALECIEKALTLSSSGNHKLLCITAMKVIKDGLKYGDKYFVPIARSSSLISQIPSQEDIIYGTRMKLIWHAWVGRREKKRTLRTNVLFTPNGIATFLPLGSTFVPKSKLRFPLKQAMRIGGYGMNSAFKFKPYRVPFYESIEEFKIRSKNFYNEVSFLR